MTEANVHEMRITVSDVQITFTYLNKPSQNPFQQETFKMELSVARIFHRVFNEYRKFEKKIFEKSDYEILGKSLARMLFDYAIVTDKLAEPIKSVQRDPNSRFRIYLEFTDTAGEIALLPWEYLMLEGLGKDVVTFFPAADKNSQFDLIRSISPVKAQNFDYTAVPNTKLQVILIIASTYDYPVDRPTWEGWLKKMREGFANEILFFTIEDPTQENLASQIEDYVNNIDGPYIVHYIGHAKVEGDYGYISLADDNGKSYWLRDTAVAKLFKPDGKRQPHLVILQACYSGQIVRFEAKQKNGVAMRLANESCVPAVIAMQNEITEAVGFAFFNRFYKSLTMGDDVAKATTIGRTYLGCSYNKSDASFEYESNIFGTPVIFLTTDRPFALTTKREGEGKDFVINKKCPMATCGKIWKNVPNKKFCGFNGCKGVLVVYREDDQGIPEKTQDERAGATSNIQLSTQ